MKILVTGGAGFIGSNFIRYVLENRPDWEVVNFDALTYAGNLANLADVADSENYRFVKGDISNPDDVRGVFGEKFDYVANFAAESHVDRSLYEPNLFLKTNVLGTQLLLNQALESGVKRFLHVSTDEVYGSLGPEGYFSEISPLEPNSPYSASKASADLVCRSYHMTFDMPVVITRAGNNYGPYQFPEKLIPFFITRALNNESLPLYGDGLNVRDWLYVEDHCHGILTVFEKGKDGETYNIGGASEMTNLEITRMILSILGKPQSLIKFVKDRPGHDRRYALDYTKVKKTLGWQPKMKFSEGLKKTIDWYCNNQKWWKDILSGQYRQFYELHYKERK
ncbi:MAG: dTDP-glucose 4,6-dehydratase [candidate division Zixibacteria bacterium 4484_95]|nr:MAG: dTDP-glucose 4,6-dehydratase [candidate division Zixibacteria bacterium 4484_95]RKX18157.1 MAG: dTDP-glucose 4,6-dehydratase [candidate division Zixibacteria bacterium]